MHGYAEMYRDPAEQLAAVRAAVPRRSPRRRCGATWCWTRWSKQQRLRATEAELDERIAADGRGARRVGRRELYASLQKANRLAELERGHHRGEGVRLPPLAVHRRRGDDPDDGTLYPPYIIERSSRGERTYDIFSRLLMDRIVFLGAPINDDVANIIIAQLLFLEADNPEQGHLPLHQLARAASCRAGMAIYDTMQHLRAPVNTICMGMAASMGSFLLAAGTKGKRSALPHSRIMIHQPSGGAQGTAADIEIQAREILYLRDQDERSSTPSTPASRSRPIERDMDRDRFMSAEEAKAYGLIDSGLHAPQGR